MSKILIVDDKPEVRELVGVTLEMGDYEILMADNGADALALARSELPDLMLLDIQMPGELDGLDVCRALKNGAETSQIYIIILTAKGQEWDKQQGIEAGANEYFIKPFSPLKLISKVEEVIGA